MRSVFSCFLSKVLQRAEGSRLSHYSCTCVKTEESVQVERLSKLERVDVSLEDSRHLLQTGDRQLVGDAHRVLVVLLVDAAIGSPGARWAPVLGVSVGRETPLLSDKAKRGERSQPVKPLRRIGLQMQLS